MTRLEANRKIIEKLAELVEEFPEQRFGQILINHGIIDTGEDLFYQTSDETLEKLQNANPKVI